MSSFKGLIKSDEEFIDPENITITQLMLKGNPTVKVTSDGMIRLLNRITTLENYIKAHQQTYHIYDTEGTILTLSDFAPK